MLLSRVGSLALLANMMLTLARHKHSSLFVRKKQEVFDDDDHLINNCKLLGAGERETADVGLVVVVHAHAAATEVSRRPETRDLRLEAYFQGTLTEREGSVQLNSS